jgi:hypothetical protein
MEPDIKHLRVIGRPVFLLAGPVDMGATKHFHGPPESIDELGGGTDVVRCGPGQRGA